MDFEQMQTLAALQRSGRDTPYINNRGDGNLYNDKTGMPLSRSEAFGSNARYNQMQNYPQSAMQPTPEQPESLSDMLQRVLAEDQYDAQTPYDYGSTARQNQFVYPNRYYGIPHGQKVSYVMSYDDYMKHLNDQTIYGKLQNLFGDTGNSF